MSGCSYNLVLNENFLVNSQCINDFGRIIACSTGKFMFMIALMANLKFNYFKGGQDYSFCCKTSIVNSLHQHCLAMCNGQKITSYNDYNNPANITICNQYIPAIKSCVQNYRGKASYLSIIYYLLIIKQKLSKKTPIIHINHLI